MAMSDPLLTNQKLVSDVVSGQGYNVHRLCTALNLRPSEFAQLAQRATESVSRTVKNDAFVQLEHAETIKTVKELVELLGLSRALNMDAAGWLRTPLPSYEGRTPAELIGDGKGRELITRLLGLAVGDVGG
jgi:hypothetical protein